MDNLTVVASRNEPARHSAEEQSSRRAAAACRSEFMLIAPIFVPFLRITARHAADFFAGVVLCADHFADGNTLGLFRRSVWARQRY